MSKKQETFRLKPGHLVKAVLAVCVLAIIAVIVGIAGTFNTQDSLNQANASSNNGKQPSGVELWKPAGAEDQEIQIVPDMGGSNPVTPKTAPVTEDTSDEEENSETVAEQEPVVRNPTHNTVRKAPKKPEAEQEDELMKLVKEPEKSKLSAQDILDGKTLDKPQTRSENKRSESKRSESKPDTPKPVVQENKPSGKSQPKEVIDNLF